MKTRVFAFFFIILLVVPIVLLAQEFRGTISGVVTDPSGAAVPGVQVTATETQTGTKTQTVSNAEGQYTLPFLLPGDYQVQATGPGFKEFIRKGIHLTSSDHPVVDIHLEVGVATESVEVTANIPLLNTENASTGQVITTKQVEDFPLNGRTPLMLAQLAVGVLATANPAQVHPFDNNGGAAWSIGGTPAQTSEILLDGSPDEIWSGSFAYSPPQDAVQEVTVDAFNTDAAYGHTFAGTVNQVLKSGTNGFHGSMYEFNQADALAANLWLSDKNGKPKQVTHFNQYGLTAGGPVMIPKVFNGRNKLFWFFAWENLDDAQPTSDLTTVPTDAERKGDFSALLALGPQYQIYNPYSGTLSGKTINRQPFLCDASGNPLPTNTNMTQTPTSGSVPCNIIPSTLLNPVSLAYLNFFPEPNAAGQSDGFQNYANTNTSADSFDNELGRLDYNMTERSHMFFDFRHNNRLQAKNNYFGNVATGTTLLRENWGGTVDEVYTFSPTLVADVRFNGTYMREIHGDPSIGFDPTQLGFPSYIKSSSQFLILPFAGFSGSCGSQTSFQCLGNTGDSRDPSASYQIFGDVIKSLGNHTLKFGTDLRQYRLDTITYGSSAGNYTFGTNWTNGPTSGSAAAPFGQDFATFLLGLPTSGTYTVNSFGTFLSRYYAFFVQDDWRVKRNLTLNLGLRYEHDTPYSESYARTVNGFDFTAASPVEAAAQSAFAADFPSGLTTDNGQPPLAQLNVPGGLTLATPGNKGAYQVNSHMFSPRAGFAWSPSFWRFGSSTVRGGFGIFVSPIALSTLDTNGNYSSNPILDQEGYSATTQFVATTNNYLSPAATLSNPFPSPGGIQQPVGSSLGLGTFLGQTVSFLNPNMKDPYSIRWNLGVQHEISPNLLLEVDYVGNHAVHLPVQIVQFNSVPAQYLSTLTTRDQTVITALSATVTNPFAGLLPGTSLNGSKVSVAQLLAPFPQFPQGTSSTSTGVLMQNYTEGTSSFNGLDVRLEKRLSYGLSIIGNYMYSKLIEGDTYLNATDTQREIRVSPFDHTHHFAAGFSYDLPIGAGRAMNLRSRWVNALLGGWTINGIYTYQTGGPIEWSNSDYVYLGGPLNPDDTRTSAPIFDVSQFDTNSKDQFQDHIRTFPSTLSSVRFESIDNLDSSILKDFHFTEGVYLQLRLEAFNAFNHPQFGAFSGSSGPNMTPTSSAFGEYNGQSNIPRAVQLGARFVW
jgi:hypothetical protein